MRKLLLIIKREYLSRILKRSFLLVTILVPLIIFVAILGLREFHTKQSLLLVNSGSENANRYISQQQRGVLDNSKMLGALGLIAAGIITISILIYSNQVMNGVREEKSGRVIEMVLISVKSFKLLLGKVIGIGLAGISQFIFWIYLGYSAIPCTINDQFNLKTLLNIQFPYNSYMLIGLFLFYLFGGYFLYSTLFITIASAVKHRLKLLLLVLLATCPLVFCIGGVKSIILNDPSGIGAYWLSVIPLTSPVAMIIRLSLAAVHINEIVCSVLLLLLAFCLLSRVASRVYRMGILMHDREPGFREILRWIWIKN